MNVRVFALGVLGVLSLGSLHACSSGDDQGSAAGGSAGTSQGAAGRGGASLGGSDAVGGGSGTASEGTNDGGAGEAGGTDGATGRGGRAAAAGTGTRGGKGGSNGAGRPSASAGTGGTQLLGEAGATAGASASGAAGETANGGAAGDGTSPTCVDDLNLPLVDTPPATLDQTGLYASPSSAPEDIAPYVYEFTPRYPLWSDGAQKRRFMYLPKCTRIDTSDMNHWKFPVGTRFWKEFTFSVNSAPVRVETRFIHHYGPGDNDWLFIAYQWDPNVAAPTAGNTAPVPNGVVDANGTTHDIPTNAQCTFCHGNLPERILGFSAFELSANPGNVSMATLSHEHLLTVAAPNGFSPPGSSVQQDGLGYLHANCGGCHNAFLSVTPAPAPRMRLLVEQTTVETTDTYTTLCNVPTDNPAFEGVDRVLPGDHADSEIIARMSQRGALQMPPIATELVDSDGVAKVAAFIDSLTP
jgi:hypothetical protein